MPRSISFVKYREADQLGFVRNLQTFYSIFIRQRTFSTQYAPNLPDPITMASNWTPPLFVASSHVLQLSGRGHRATMSCLELVLAVRSLEGD
jgi:hypothetical protein